MKNISLWIAFLTLSSCTHLQDFPVRGEFTGVQSALECKESVSLLIVHGMGGFSEGDPDTLIATIRSKLNLVENGSPCVREVIDDHFGCPKKFGEVTRQEYRGVCSPYKLFIYTLDWTDSTKHEKHRLEELDAPYKGDRVALINTFKDIVIDNDLADAVLYASHYRNEIHYPFAQAIRWIEEDSKNESYHGVVVVGFSIGGTILINTLDAMQGRGKDHDDIATPQADRFIKELSAIFMLSNAAPIFELTELPYKTHFHYQDRKPCNRNECSECCATEEINSGLSRFILEKRKYCPGFQIVSFTDPNDPLSYVLDNHHYSFINEMVRNVKWSLFGLVDPIEAHTGYGHNRKVLDMIIFGAEEKNCCCNELMLYRYR